MTFSKIFKFIADIYTTFIKNITKSIFKNQLLKIAILN